MIIKEKINIFFKDSKQIHISLKAGFFRNGFVKEVNALFLIFKDRQLGDIPIFYSEINDVEPYLEERKDG